MTMQNKRRAQRRSVRSEVVEVSQAPSVPASSAGATTSEPRA